MTTGFIHPGSMGASLAAACRGETAWASAGRSAATARRADTAGMVDVGDLDGLVARCDVIVSICPPAAALDVAAAVAERGFTGVYVDANAIAPDTARRVGARFDRFVDGGVIGPPAHRAGTTRLYLSGEEAAPVAALWDGSALDARVVAGGAGAASALKMAYAAWTKGTSALLYAVMALAETEGVGEALVAEWALSQPALESRARDSAASVASKAWRWVGEMEEIASTFEGAGLPPGFHAAAADVYRRLAGLKDAPAPALDQVVTAVADPAHDAPAAEPA